MSKPSFSFNSTRALCFFDVCSLCVAMCFDARIFVSSRWKYAYTAICEEKIRSWTWARMKEQRYSIFKDRFLWKGHVFCGRGHDCCCAHHQVKVLYVLKKAVVFEWSFFFFFQKAVLQNLLLCFFFLVISA